VRCWAGGMFGVAPADEERDQLVSQLATRRAPPQHRTVWRDSVPVGNLARVIAVAAGLGDRPIDVVAGKRPADQLAASDTLDPEGTRDGRLGLAWIRGR
jgi:hypothetical protein